MADDFQRPLPLQMRGSKLARFVFEGLGWRVRFEGLPARQGVLIAYPHTSNWDFIFLMLAKWSVGLELNFWGKASLFRIPVLGTWLRWVGGIDVDRHAPHGIVGDMVRTMLQCKATDTALWLALAPEGTRKWAGGWRSGFYQVAVGAQVPLGICSVDFAGKNVQLTQFIMLTGDVQADMARIAQSLQNANGKYPGQVAPIRLIER